MSRDLSPDDFREPRLASQRARQIAEAIRESQRDVNHASCSRVTERPSEVGRPPISHVDGRAVLYDGARGYRLSQTQVRTIAELGKFRVIARFDLGQQAYRDRPELLKRDVDYLLARGLVLERTFCGPEATPRELLTLTRNGHRLVRANVLVPADQAVHHGFLKPNDANHDADLYRVYQKEVARVEQAGGRKIRIVLDCELKRKINRDVARLGIAANPEIARRHHLQVVGHKIPVPDLRIEYEARDGTTARVDLELVTENYRGRSAEEKARAGFRLFTPRGEADHLRRMLDQRGLSAEVWSL